MKKLSSESMPGVCSSILFLNFKKADFTYLAEFFKFNVTFQLSKADLALGEKELIFSSIHIEQMKFFFKKALRERPKKRAGGCPEEWPSHRSKGCRSLSLIECKLKFTNCNYNH